MALFPFEVVTDDVDPWYGLGLSLSIMVEDKDHLVSIQELREQYNNLGLKISDPAPLAAKIEMARACRAEVLTTGTIDSDRIHLKRIHLPSLTIDETEFERKGRVTDWAFQISQHLGLGTVMGREVDEFFHLWATCYAVDDQLARERAFRSLLQRNNESDLLFREFEELCGDPIAEEIDPDELVFWRDVYWQNQRYHAAFKASFKLLTLDQRADHYHVHAEILSSLGEEIMSCQYALTAVALGYHMNPADACQRCVSSHQTSAGPSH